MHSAASFFGEKKTGWDDRKATKERGGAGESGCCLRTFVYENETIKLFSYSYTLALSVAATKYEIGG